MSNQSAVHILEIEPGLQAEAFARDLISRGIIHGVLAVDTAAMRKRTFRLQFVHDDPLAVHQLREALRLSLVELNVRRLDLDRSLLMELHEPVHIAHSTMEVPDSSDRYLMGMMAAMLLFMAVLHSGGSFLRGVLEERSNRLIEVLVSSVSPVELMAGKLFGLGLAGLVQFMVWMTAGGLFGGLFAQYIVSPWIGFQLVVCFLLGYFLMASIFLSLGVFFTNEQDIQSWQAILSVVAITPVLFAFTVMKDPNSQLVNLLSYVPLLTPTLMTFRLMVSQPPWYHLVGTGMTMAIFCVILLRISALALTRSLWLAGNPISLKAIWRLV